MRENLEVKKWRKEEATARFLESRDYALQVTEKAPEMKKETTVPKKLMNFYLMIMLPRYDLV